MNIWERAFTEATETEDGLTLERAKEVGDDWVSFGKVHVLLRALAELLEGDTRDREHSKEHRKLSRQMTTILRKAAKEAEANEAELDRLHGSEGSQARARAAGRYAVPGGNA